MQTRHDCILKLLTENICIYYFIILRIIIISDHDDNLSFSPALHFHPHSSKPNRIPSRVSRDLRRRRTGWAHLNIDVRYDIGVSALPGINDHPVAGYVDQVNAGPVFGAFRPHPCHTTLDVNVNRGRTRYAFRVIRLPASSRIALDVGSSRYCGVWFRRIPILAEHPGFRPRQHRGVATRPAAIRVDAFRKR